MKRLSRIAGLSAKCLGLLFITAVVMPSAVQAADKHALYALGVPVSISRLAELRGGFIFGGASQGLEVSFAIQQVTYVNGQLVAETHLNVPAGADLSGLTSLLASPQIIQNGPGNTFSPALNDLAHGSLTVLQNTLDNQTIANATIIDATVASRGFLSGLALSNALNDALSRSRN